ncbi:hypothetical protein [Chromobacterium violaceum]|uniref:hypothetical protein n=1 Tax=Chromobacterium violaceum TaxID=536 RepID=UPI001C8C620F|nr:hypothetical protein [Chromobacterium violaceum]MBX9268622.1 hypothetical protein [Chromobacterium violaceum]
MTHSNIARRQHCLMNPCAGSKQLQDPGGRSRPAAGLPKAGSRGQASDRNAAAFMVVAAHARRQADSASIRERKNATGPAQTRCRHKNAAARNYAEVMANRPDRKNALPMSATIFLRRHSLEKNKPDFDIKTRSQSLTQADYLGAHNQFQLNNKITPRHSALKKEKPVHINRHYARKPASNWSRQLTVLLQAI